MAHGERAHPSPRQYVAVAVVLAIVTAAEVAVYYVPALEDYLVAILLVMAVIKFALVALWFMHLRFDSHIFRSLFILGIVLALALFAIVLVNFFTRGGPAPGVTT